MYEPHPAPSTYPINYVFFFINRFLVSLLYIWLRVRGRTGGEQLGGGEGEGERAEDEYNRLTRGRCRITRICFIILFFLHFAPPQSLFLSLSLSLSDRNTHHTAHHTPHRTHRKTIKKTIRKRKRSPQPKYLPQTPHIYKPTKQETNDGQQTPFFIKGERRQGGGWYGSRPQQGIY